MMNQEVPCSSSNSVESFQPNSLIWAKMKGFPPWPAKVLPQSEDTPQGRIKVMFFGTKENAFMKASDCSDYMSNKNQYEIPRKQKGFNDAVHEIRVEAGIEKSCYRDPQFFPPSDSPDGKAQGVLATLATTKSFASLGEPSSGRIRRESARFTDNFFSDLTGKRSNSGSAKTRSRASSTHSKLKFLHKQLSRRRRLDSESSNGSRRRQMISGGLNNDLVSNIFEMPHETMSNFHDQDYFLNLADDNRSNRSTKSFRPTTKMLEDFALGMEGRVGRNRSGSHSEGKRSRLISGVSDIFDDLFSNGDISNPGAIAALAADFMTTLDDIPSESSETFPTLLGREGTPEAPELLPTSLEFCKNCGSECKRYRSRWICSNSKCVNSKPNEWAKDANQPDIFSSSVNRNELNTKTEENAANEDGNQTEDDESSLHKKHLISPRLQREKRRSRGKIKLKKEEKTKSSKEQSRDDYEKHDKKLSVSIKEKRKNQITSPRQFSISPPTSPRLKSPGKEDQDVPVKDKRPQGRPKQYKVEKTPPVSKNGLRHCSYCNGQVRPQMCGGNKHRWRCVDKKCRKWYGWVKSNDEIPMDLGRKGRYNSVLGRIKLKKIDKGRKRKLTEKSEASISSAVEAARAAAHLEAASLKSGETERSTKMRTTLMTLAEMKKKQAAESLLKMKDSKEAVKKLKTTKKTLKKKEPLVKKEEEPTRPISPLTHREMRYRPCGMEKRARWWLSEKRRADPSPERELQTGMADAAAAFRILSHAFRAAAVTRADEIGTVNGSLDLMMDSLLGCMGPLLSLLSKLPNTRPDPAVVKQLWNASAVHIPIFQ